METNELSVYLGILNQTAAFRNHTSAGVIPCMIQKVHESLHDEVDAHQITRIRKKFIDHPIGMVRNKFPHINHGSYTPKFEIQ